MLPVFVQQYKLLLVPLQLLSCPVFAQCWSFPASWVWHLLVLQFTSLSLLLVPIVMQLIVNMFSNLISGIPNKACLFPGTTKKFHILHLLLFSNVTLHMHNCIIVDQLYIFTLIFISFVAANCPTFTLGNNFLKM